MPSVAKSSKWFIRVDGNKEFLTEKLKELSQSIECVKLLALYHLGDKGENPHTHFCIDTNVVLQQQSFSVRIKKQFSISKKSEYSIKVWDGNDAACSYMFHEVDEVVLCNKGYSDNDIERFRELNCKVQEVIAINKQRGGRVVGRLVEEYTNDGKPPDREDILSRMLQMIRDGEMYEPGDFQLMRYIEEVYLKTRMLGNKEDAEYRWKDYVAQRSRRLFRNL